MRNFVPCATNHVAMFRFVVLSADDGGAGFALTVEATSGLGWGGRNTDAKCRFLIISHKLFGPRKCETIIRM